MGRFSSLQDLRSTADYGGGSLDAGNSLNAFGLENDFFNNDALANVSSGAGGMDWGGLASGFGNVAKGVGGLMGAYNALQSLKFAKNRAKIADAQWQKNYDAQRDDVAYDRGQRAQSRGIAYS